MGKNEPENLGSFQVDAISVVVCFPTGRNCNEVVPEIEKFKS